MRNLARHLKWWAGVYLFGASLGASVYGLFTDDIWPLYVWVVLFGFGVVANAYIIGRRRQTLRDQLKHLARKAWK